MAGFPVTRAGAILAVSDVERSVAFYRDLLGFDRRGALRRPALRDARARGCAALAGRAGPSGRGPARGRRWRRRPTASRADVVLVARGRRRAGRARASSQAEGVRVPRRAVQPAVGRLPLLLRRPRRLPRRDRAARVRAVVLRAPGDVGVEEVPDPRSSTRATRSCGSTRDGDLRRRPLPLPRHDARASRTARSSATSSPAMVVEVGADVAALRPGRAGRQHEHDLGRHLRRTAARAASRSAQGRALFGYSGVYPRLDGGQAELVRVPHADRCSARARPTRSPTRRRSSSPTSCPTGYGAVVRGGVERGRHGRRASAAAPVGLMAVLVRGRRRRGGCIAVDGVAERRALAERLGARGGRAGRGRGRGRATRPAGSAPTSSIEAAGVAGGARRGAAARPRPRHGLRRRRALRARLPARQRPHVRARADAALLDRRPGRRPRGAAGDGRRRGPRPDAGVTHRMPLADAAEAYRLFDAREATKVVLPP